MTRRARPLSAYVSACCKAPLAPRRGGWYCTECNTVGCKRRSVAWLEKQAEIAVTELGRAAPELQFTKEQRDRLWAKMTGEAYDD